MIHVLERAKYDHRKIQYASSKVPLEIWLEGRIRQSTICQQVYVWIEVKEQSTDVKNVGNRTIEYKIYDTGLRMDKLRTQEDSILLLEGPNQTIAGRSAQKVNNLPAYICMYRGEGANHQRQQRR